MSGNVMVFFPRPAAMVMGTGEPLQTGCISNGDYVGYSILVGDFRMKDPGLIMVPFCG